MQDIPGSIAIAGSEGFMGQNIVKAALGLGIEKIFLCDPRIKAERYSGCRNVEIVGKGSFNDIDADLFHFATPPGQRYPMYRLIERGCHINVEKPMVHPENPTEAQVISEALQGSSATLLFDFLEMFNPRTKRIVEYLNGISNASIDSMTFTRGKNRENLWNPRNKVMILPITFQETGHCNAYLVNLLANYREAHSMEFEDLFPTGVKIRAVSQRYDAPNPEKYGYAVDGYCAGLMDIGDCFVYFTTNFKRGAEKAKRKEMRFSSGGSTIEITVDNQPGNEYLTIDGEEQRIDGEQDQYKNVILGSWKMHQEMGQGVTGVRPDARMAWLAFGLGGAQFMASYLQTSVTLKNMDDLNEAALYFSKNIESYKRGKYRPKPFFIKMCQYASDWFDREGRKDTMPNAVPDAMHKVA